MVEISSLSIGGLLLVLGLLALLAFVGFVTAIRLRRWAKGPHEESSTAFTLEDLRRLHRTGQLSDEEFRRASESMLARRPSAEEIARYRFKR